MKRWAVLGVTIVLPCLLFVAQVRAVQEPQDTQEVVRIRRLDGGCYEPHSPAVTETVQGTLKDGGLYRGEVNGQLDEATMKAIGELRKENSLTVSGVPSPATRKLLLQE